MARGPRAFDAFLANLLFGSLHRVIEFLRVRYRSPTRDWPARSVDQLSYDMRHRALNGVQIGAPLERLRLLGPADSFDTYDSWLTLYYYPLGLSVSVSNEQFHSFEVVLEPRQCPDLSRHAFASGRLVLTNHEGRLITLTGATSEAEVVHVLGRPVETGPVVGQTCHTFITADHQFDTTHEPASGRLLRIDLVDAGSRTRSPSTITADGP